MDVYTRRDLTLPKSKHYTVKVGTPNSDTVQRNKRYTLGIWMPHSDKVTFTVAAALKKKAPFMVLMPSCLVTKIAQRADGTYDADIQAKVKATKKLVLLGPGLTWLYHNTSVKTDRVCTLRKHDNRVLATKTWTLKDVFDDLATAANVNASGLIPLPFKLSKTEWIAEQKAKDLEAAYKKLKLPTALASNGLLLYAPKGAPSKVIVPPSKRQQLAMYTHQCKGHVGYAKIYKILAAQNYHWPSMQKDIREWVPKCPTCQSLHATRHMAHGHFRARAWTTPRTVWMGDYHGVQESDDGYREILGFIDTVTLKLILTAGKNRTAQFTTQVVLNKIVLENGVPLRIHTDAAREFVGKAMQALCKMMLIAKTDTMAHNPQGNALIERVWRFVVECLCLLSDEEYRHWQLYLPLIQHMWNTTPRTATG